MTETRFTDGDLVLWHTDERSYEGWVMGRRVLAGGTELVHVKPMGSDWLVAIRADELTLLAPGALIL